MKLKFWARNIDKEENEVNRQVESELEEIVNIPDDILLGLIDLALLRNDHSIRIVIDQYYKLYENANKDFEHRKIQPAEIFMFMYKSYHNKF